MTPKRPDITDEDIGMRAFQLRKEKAVERALERVRAGLKDDWAAFSQRDIADLSWMLGEVWAYQKRSCWDDLHFSKLMPSDVVEIITLARELKEEQRNSVETIEKVTEIILSRD